MVTEEKQQHQFTLHIVRAYGQKAMDIKHEARVRINGYIIRSRNESLQLAEEAQITRAKTTRRATVDCTEGQERPRKRGQKA